MLLWGRAPVKTHVGAWARRRRQYEALYPKQCASCYLTPEDGVKIELHHTWYNDYYPMWDERRRSEVDDSDLMWLCEREHDIVTALHRNGGMTPKEATNYYMAGADQRPFYIEGGGSVWWSRAWRTVASWAGATTILAVVIWLVLQWFAQRVPAFSVLLDPTRQWDKFGTTWVVAGITVAALRHGGLSGWFVKQIVRLVVVVAFFGYMAVR